MSPMIQRTRFFRACAEEMSYFVIFVWHSAFSKKWFVIIELFKSANLGLPKSENWSLLGNTPPPNVEFIIVM